MTTTWIVQENLNLTAGRNTLDLLARAVAEAERKLVRVKVIPFVEEMPELAPIEPPFVFYGYTTLITNAWRSATWRSGVFFVPELFTPATYTARYGDLCLNADLEITTFAELDQRHYASDLKLFVRPNDDLKHWTGGVMTFAEFQAWFAGFKHDLDLPVNANSHLCVSRARDIDAEYRLFVVDGRAIASTQYRPRAVAWVPQEVIDYGERVADIWTPTPVVVMDVARTGTRLKIIELNCFNGCGFYLADVERIVRVVSAYMESKA